MQNKVELKRAQREDFDFAWGVYAETTRSHIAPKLKNGWRDEEQKLRFREWWDPQKTSIISADGQNIGWISFFEAGNEATLEHCCIVPAYQAKGIGSEVIERLVKQWNTQKKSVHAGVLKENRHIEELLARLGFKKVGTDQLTVQMKLK